MLARCRRKLKKTFGGESLRQFSCRRKLKKTFGGESLRQFRKVFRKLRWLESSG